MELTDDDILEFQEIWRNEFKETISADDARQRFHELIELYAFFARAARKRPGPDNSASNV